MFISKKALSCNPENVKLMYQTNSCWSWEKFRIVSIIATTLTMLLWGRMMHWVTSVNGPNCPYRNLTCIHFGIHFGKKETKIDSATDRSVLCRRDGRICPLELEMKIENELFIYLEQKQVLANFNRYRLIFITKHLRFIIDHII